MTAVLRDNGLILQSLRNEAYNISLEIFPAVTFYRRPLKAQSIL